MKKILAIILADAMLLSICACGRRTEENVPEAPAEEIVTYKVESENYSDSCTYDDGTVIANCSFDMPCLHAYLSDGTEVTEDLVASQPSDALSRALSVVTAFNAEMDGQLSSKQTFVREMYEWAKEGYERSLEFEESWFEAYTEEQTFTVYQTDKIVSVCMQFYDYLGGAHPNNGYSTYNFDLTAGEMVTYADLVKDDVEFRAAVSEEILKQIQEQGIADGLFEDYEAYVRDLAYADDCYDDNGITFIFEEYSIGPHAAGSLVFDIPYSMIANLLNDRGRELLPIKQEDVVLADFYETRELWACFYVCTLPEVNDSKCIEVDGNVYRPVDYKDISTMAQLRELLLTHVSEEVADKWLTTDLYREIDGVLCVMGAGRGEDEFEETFEVQLAGDGGKIVETANHIDYLSREIDGTSIIEYPFVLQDGHAIFTSFDCPL